MEDLILLGAGGHAREILDIVAAIDHAAIDTRFPNFRAVGLIDERPETRGREVAGVRILGGFEWFEENAYEGAVVSAVGDTRLRERFVRRASDLGVRFARVVSPLASVAASAVLGEGVVVFPFVFISNETAIGDHTHCNAAASISHDSRIGAFTTLGPRSTLTGRVTLGRGVTVGASATVLPDVLVGDYCVIGAGSVVTAALDAYTVSAGSPARIIRAVEKEPPRDA
jgi:sugar O-acyltransferase (sialic acid O-acetyltransferase NeuD family)